MTVNERNGTRRVFEDVVDYVQNLVLDGWLRGGDKLPTERELARSLDVSRASIREAMRSLEIVGLVESRQGGGNYIRGHLGKSLLEPLSLLFQINGGRLEDVLELRRIVEVAAAAVAATRLSDGDRRELEGLLAELDGTDHEERKALLDKQMHVKIVSLSGNPLLIGLYDSISALLDRFFLLARRRISLWKESYDELLLQHRAICGALFDGDASRAASEMRNHLDHVAETLKRSS